MKSFKQNFTEICYEKGHTPTKVLKMIGMNPSSYSLWDDTSIPRMENVFKMASFLNVSVNELLNFDRMSDADFDSILERDNSLPLDEARVAETFPILAANPLDPQEQELIKIFRKLDARSQFELISTAMRLGGDK